MSMYYNLDKLYSRDFLIALVIGERGVGKSFSTKLAMLKRFIRTGEQFIYIRRYKTELDTALATFWDDLQANGYFDDLDLKVQKSKMLTKFTCDGAVCGYAIPLSTANILKSTSFPDVSTIIMDEFLLDNAGTYRYLKHEVTLLLDVIETVFRLRDGKVILLGNNLAPHASPYFCYWNLELPEEGKEFRSFNDGAIVVQYIRNEEYRKAKKESKFGKLITGTDYGDYAIDNVALRENSDFIAKKPDKSQFFGALIMNGVSIGIWSRGSCYYLSEKYDPNTNFKFAMDFDDHTEDTIFEGVSTNLYVHALVRAYKIGCLFFENQRIKSTVVKLLNRCIR